MESSSEQTPIEAHRPWRKLHWLTWVLVLLVGGSLVVENLAGQIVAWQKGFRVNFGKGGSICSHGWPFRFEKRRRAFTVTRGVLSSSRWLFGLDRWLFGLDKLRGVQRFHFLPFITNILIALLILASTAFTTESYLRSQTKWQFSIQGIMAFTAFVALILANTKYDLVRWHGSETWEYIPFFFIAMGLWCVFWTGWRLIGWGVGRVGGGSVDG